MWLRRLLVGLLLFMGSHLFSQTDPSRELYFHEQESLYHKVLNLDLVNDTTYDVKFYYPDVEINLDEPYISGKVTYLIASKIDGLTQIKLDLDDAFTVDSISMPASGFEFSNKILTIDFSSVYNIGDTLSFSIFYQGTPVLAGGYKGLRYETHGNNELIIASLSTPYLAHTWWPCKDGTLDKADSLYMDITIKDTLIAGIPVIGVSNGVLSGVETYGNKKKFKWRHRYPIVPYYVMVAISNYVEFQQEYNNGEDTFPLIYYVFESDLNSAQTGVADLPEVFDLYSNLFGPYPFANEKYGMTQLGYYGGIENQTNTIINNMGPSWFGTSVHELAHSWFADMITCETWHHGWLNEGFATYSEGLWYEYSEGEAAFKDFMVSAEYFNSGTVYLQNIDDPFNIFQSIIYEKGAWVLHMLRGILGDEVFFEAIHTYATSPEFEYNLATTEQFQELVENVSGMDLDYFFEQWIYEERYPKYEYNFEYNANNGILEIEVDQTQGENGWLAVFSMPIQLKIIFSENSDTLITVFNDQQFQNFSFFVTKEVDNIEFDPDNWILKKAIYNPDIIVSTDEYIADQIKVYPNPNNGTFYVYLPEQINNELTLRLINLNGKLIFSTSIPEYNNGQFKVNPGPVQPGFYFLELISGKNKWVKKLIIRYF